MDDSPRREDARRHSPLLVATRNKGKLGELRALFAGVGYRVLDLGAAGVPPSPAEDEVEAFDSFEENALAKARYYREASGGLPTVADDSGLAVDALGGAPGVRSRRWSGVVGPDGVVSAANNAKLLHELRDAPDRGARFVCAVAYVSHAGAVVERGETVGRIASAPRGSNGFGYDPLFESADLDWRTFGEVGAETKALVSHRARALAQLARRMHAFARESAG